MGKAAVQKVSIDYVVPIYDPNVKWCDLGSQFKGYELSNTGILRSMKFFKAYPFGILINPDKNGMYELSDCSNRRVKLTMGDMQTLCKGRKFDIETASPLRNSRNSFIGSKSKYMTKGSEVDQNKLKEPYKFKVGPQ